VWYLYLHKCCKESPKAKCDLISLSYHTDECTADVSHYVTDVTDVTDVTVQFERILWNVQKNEKAFTNSINICFSLKRTLGN
jgi:hypothetical protein